MVLRKTKVCCDGLGTFEGYVEERTWNGWSAPWFTKEVANEIMTAVNEQVNEYVLSKLVYDDYLKAFIEVVMYLKEDKTIDFTETGAFTVENMNTEDGPKDLYPIGNTEWCWYEDREE